MIGTGTIHIAVRALLRNKVRSLLTTLGIIVGIAALITVVAINEGAAALIKSKIESMGNNLLTVFPGSTSAGGFFMGAGSQVTLTADDADAILREADHIVAVSPIVRSSCQVIYKSRNWSTVTQGASESYLEVRGWDVEKGAFFEESDVRGATRVALLGVTIANQLFEDEDPIGKIIRLRNMPFRVIGVLTQKGSNAFGQDQDDVVVVPWRTAKRVLQKSQFNDVAQILVSLDSLDNLDSARKEITAILRQRHHLATGTDDDFTIRDMTELTQMISQVSQTMKVLLTAVALISLIVGGIGIMNIMLVSVTERTREIGLRMAVGAKRGDILLQFLVEAMSLSAVGGFFGVLIGTGTVHLVSSTKGWPVLISNSSIVLALVFSAVVGGVFGIYPAFRASRLNPIEALRYE